MAFTKIKMSKIAKIAGKPGHIEEDEEEMYLPVNQFYNSYQLLVGLNECDYIREMLNKNYLGKVPSKAGES